MAVFATWSHRIYVVTTYCGLCDTGRSSRSIYQNTPCPKRTMPFIFASHFAKYWPIFKILSPADLAVN